MKYEFEVCFTINTLMFFFQVIFSFLTKSIAIFSDSIDTLIDSIILFLPILTKLLFKIKSSSLKKEFKFYNHLLGFGLIISYRLIIIIQTIIGFIRIEQLDKPIYIIIVGSITIGINLLLILIFEINEAREKIEKEGLNFFILFALIGDMIGGFIILIVGLVFKFTKNNTHSKYVDLSLTLAFSIAIIIILLINLYIDFKKQYKKLSTISTYADNNKKENPINIVSETDVNKDDGIELNTDINKDALNTQ